MPSPEESGGPISIPHNTSNHLQDYDDVERHLRSSSPAVKRPASDMGAEDREDHVRDVDMDTASASGYEMAHAGETDGGQVGSVEVTPKAKYPSLSPRHSRELSSDMVTQYTRGDEKNKTPSEATMSSISLQTPSVASTEATSIRSTPPTVPSAEVPSIDEQVAKVMAFMLKQPLENQLGYVVSSNWLNRVLARSSEGPRGSKVDKSATLGEIGPVNNADLVFITNESGQFKDERGEPFIALRPGLALGEDFEVLPQEAWDLVVKWHGIAKEAPVIKRYMHDTNVDGAQENLIWELYPPIFTILKVLAYQDTEEQQKEKSLAPARLLASRSTKFNVWLTHAKKLASIDVKDKVRVWRILGGLKASSSSGMITPAASRSASPAPGANVVVNAGDSLVLDTPTFSNLEVGPQRELMEITDQTMNEKYNGNATLQTHMLNRDDVIVLEQVVGGPGGGEWPSEVKGQRLGPLSGGLKSAALAAKAKAGASSGRSSPGPGMVTRGRQRKDGKPRGITGLSNLGNTCYMNSALQCVRSVEELTQYFLHDNYKKELNPGNPLAHNGEVARAYANLLHQMYSEGTSSSTAPRGFKSTIGKYGASFSGYGQQDSQEFLGFLLDGLQEDLNRIHKKPYVEKPDSTDEMVHNFAALKAFADQNWEMYKARNDSVITDLFAGMYKSTVTCPVCDKVSIIFDPFNNVTLQLPIPNLWSKDMFYFPLHGRPIRIAVDIDKNATVKDLKDYIAKRAKADPKKLIMAEVYKIKFYKMFDNSIVIGEAGFTNGDDLVMFEVESIPTNYNPNKPPSNQYRSMITYGNHSAEDTPTFESEGGDRMLIPIFNRVLKPSGGRMHQKQLFGCPYYIIVNREEAHDYDSILRKILGKLATMTTRDILNEEQSDTSDLDTPEDSDTVVTNDEDMDSDSNKIQSASVESEEGLVDVSMKDDSGTSAAAGETSSHETTLPRVLRPGVKVPSRFRNMFEMRIISSPSETIPLGFSNLNETTNYTSMSTRLPSKAKMQTPSATSRSSDERRNSSTSEEDPDDTLPISIENAPALSRSQVSDSDNDSNDQSTQQASGSDSDLPAPESIIHRDSRRNSRQMKTYSRKGNTGTVKKANQAFSGPLIRPGEGIVLDWTYDAHSALFDGEEGENDPMRGTPTWVHIDQLKDEELQQKRELRQSRRKKGISLDDCLDEFGKEEILSQNDAWYCPRCKEHRRASKKFEIWKAPDILVMHLKRFSASRRLNDKIEVLVDYPVENLDLSERVIEHEDGKSLVYDLIAVDNHYGGLGGGHYTAFAQNFFDHGWYEYNDSHVSAKSNSQVVVTSAAYLLFYRRRSSHPLGGPFLEQVVEEVNRPADLPADSESQSQPGSRAASPVAGEGRRLGGSSLHGSSSALLGAGAAHQSGDGGSGVGARARNDDGPPGYSNNLGSGETHIASGGTQHLEDLSMEDEGLGDFQGPLAPSSYQDDNPMWSFDRIRSGGAMSQMAALPPGFHDPSEEDLFETDAASNKAANSSAGLSDGDDRMRDFGDDEDMLEKFNHSPARRGSPAEVPPPLDGEDEDEIPVQEIHLAPE